MVDAERQMPGHVKAAYRDAVDNILFLKRQLVAGDQLSLAVAIAGPLRWGSKSVQHPKCPSENILNPLNRL